mmetsp:Transcript_15513/g.22797  ORF Transcript_15513/g.22797 Transcript_15513/m.22797 type:complete len:405 (-) Transcript_15513:277-1491(-)
MNVGQLPLLSALLLVLLATATAADSHAPPDPSLNWDSFGFGLNGVQTEFMWLDKVDATKDDGEPYSDDCLTPLGPLELHPASTILNYGQGLFEGLKAFRRSKDNNDNDEIVLFRPDCNAERMAKGANRFLMPPVPTPTFLRAAKAVVRANAKFVPPFGKGALYLRPILFGSGHDLGVKPSHEVTFCIYGSPVGNYFKGELQAIQLLAVQGYSRAAPGGSGGIKAGGNYAPAFQLQRRVKQMGYDEVLCVDALSGEAVEEAGASNFFAVFSKNRTIITPSLDQDTILEGVTRRSILELASNECGYEVRERRLTLDDLQDADEAFCCGTGASVTPVGSVSVAHKDDLTTFVRRKIVFGDNDDDDDNDTSKPGPLTKTLYKMLLSIQMGTDKKLCEKYKHWIHVVEP